jgi:glycosyltransferase involved in cell wall biosynthesis
MIGIDNWLESKNQYPKISVITPTYNRAPFLPQVWQSLKVQTEEDFEWIIVDDGSTDNTHQIVQQLQKEDNRIRYIRLTENRGVNFARAKGVDQSKAPYIVFLDSDDMLYDRYTLKMMLDEIEATANDIGAVAFTVVNEQGILMSFLEQERMVLRYEEIVCEQKAKGEFIMICKKQYLSAAPWSPYQGLECLHHFARARYYQVLYINRPGRIYYSDASNKLTSATSALKRANQMAEGYLRLIKDHGETWRNCCPKQLGRYLFYAGMYFALAGQTTKALVCIGKALLHNGPVLKSTLVLFSCLLPVPIRRWVFIRRASKRHA